MFPRTYFAGTYFTGDYWPQSSNNPPSETALEFFLRIFRATPSITFGGGTFTFSFATYKWITAAMMDDAANRGSVISLVRSLLRGNAR